MCHPEFIRRKGEIKKTDCFGSLTSIDGPNYSQIIDCCGSLHRLMVQIIVSLEEKKMCLRKCSEAECMLGLWHLDHWLHIPDVSEHCLHINIRFDATVTQVLCQVLCMALFFPFPIGEGILEQDLPSPSYFHNHPMR